MHESNQKGVLQVIGAMYLLSVEDRIAPNAHFMFERCRDSSRLLSPVRLEPYQETKQFRSIVVQLSLLAAICEPKFAL